MTGSILSSHPLIIMKSLLLVSYLNSDEVNFDESLMRRREAGVDPVILKGEWGTNEKDDVIRGIIHSVSLTTLV